MKRKLYLIMLLVLIFALFVACNSEPAAKTDSDTDSESLTVIPADYVDDFCEMVLATFEFCSIPYDLNSYGENEVNGWDTIETHLSQELDNYLEDFVFFGVEGASAAVGLNDTNNGLASITVSGLTVREENDMGLPAGTCSITFTDIDFNDEDYSYTFDLSIEGEDIVAHLAYNVRVYNYNIDNNNAKSEAVISITAFYLNGVDYNPSPVEDAVNEILLIAETIVEAFFESMKLLVSELLEQSGLELEGDSIFIAGIDYVARITDINYVSDSLQPLTYALQIKKTLGETECQINCRTTWGLYMGLVIETITVDGQVYDYFELIKRNVDFLIRVWG